MNQYRVPHRLCDGFRYPGRRFFAEVELPGLKVLTRRELHAHLAASVTDPQEHARHAALASPGTLPAKLHDLAPDASSAALLEP